MPLIYLATVHGKAFNKAIVVNHMHSTQGLEVVDSLKHSNIVLQSGLRTMDNNIHKCAKLAMGGQQSLCVVCLHVRCTIHCEKRLFVLFA